MEGEVSGDPQSGAAKLPQLRFLCFDCHKMMLNRLLILPASHAVICSIGLLSVKSHNSNLKTTQALVDIIQTLERGLGKSRLFRF